MRFWLVLCVALFLAGCSSHRAPPPNPRLADSITVVANLNEQLRNWRGAPYRYGGNSPDGGFDCSGLITYVYRGAAGVALPRTTREMNAMRGATIRRDALKAGDLLFFATSGGRRVSHAAIYVGEGRFVHAPSTGGTVRLDSLSNSYWQKSYLSAKRVLDGDRLAQNP